MGRGVRLDRFGIGLLSLALTAVPAVAQNATVPAPATNSSSSSTVIGPAINDFNLNGTVTREAAPPATANRASSQPAVPPTAAPRPVTEAPRRVRETPATRTPVSAAPTATRQVSQSTASPLPQPPIEQPAQPPAAQDSVVMPTVSTLPGEAGSGPSLWPWILAAIAAAIAAFFLFRRQREQRGRYREAMAGPVLALDPAPQPEGPVEPLRRAPVAETPKPASTGIVSTRLHPDIIIDLQPERAIVDDRGATIEFQVTLRNHGTAPARDVRVEACMVNAGPAQDQELGAFFEHPANTAEPIPHLMPMSEINLKSAVRLKLDQMRQFEVGGRKLFVPLVGVNAIYRSSAGSSQTSASYFVGRNSNGEKMAPLRLDLGPRVFRGLGARQHTLALRR